MSGARRDRIDGRVPPGGIAEVLQALEKRSETARVHVETDVGDGEIDLVEGKIVDAYSGNLIGLLALYPLLEAPGGSFQVTFEQLQPRPAIIESVAALVERNTRRAAEWRALSDVAPALTAVLELRAEGEAALRDGTVSQSHRDILKMVDGRRTVAEVLAENGLDSVDGLRILVECGARGFLAPTMTHSSPLPITERHGTAPGRDGSAGFATERSRSSSSLGNPLRRRTSIGLGLSAPVAVQPRRVRAQRIISIGPPGSDAASVPFSLAGSEGKDASAAAAGSRREQGSHYVGRYEILCRIGRGGMGSVYLCRLNSEGGFRRLFALKVLRSHLLEDDAAARKFLEEASLAGQIHHPNVVSVVDAGLAGSQPYLVMDYVEGGSLKQLLTSHPDQRPPSLILPIIIDGLAGLHAAHTLIGDDGALVRLVHCDVSPENLLVGIDGVCRLTDFGIARHGPIARARARATHGKPSYLAPEQIRGGHLDHRADIFAMGVVLYNALTGTRLFDAPTVEETLERVCSQRIDPPSAVGLRPSPSFDFVCMRALEREPARRFESAEEMVTALRDISLREGLPARSSDIAAWVRESVGRDLAQRRLVVLDASRRRSDPPVAVAETDTRPTSQTPAAGFEAVASVRGPIAEPEIERTIALGTSPRNRRWAIIGASVLAAIAVLTILIWPEAVAALFRLDDGDPTRGAAALPVRRAESRELDAGWIDPALRGLPPATSASPPSTSVTPAP